eukprot:TRINITY_DN105332_c0_g1_i1.p1 TRINITY_DN105332_c0_g1~~TRINITY_DN105332_c0_g1_i1.p1  ORF type:complete len:479 (-),score=11.54 TRINITY_DN105332_c0_g1_i1:231-1466(-)
MKYLLTLLIIFTFTYAKWTTVTMYNSTDKILEHEYYHDKSNGYTHFAAITKKENKTFGVHVTLLPDQKSTNNSLNIDSPSAIAIKGYNNGKNLIVAFAAPRDDDTMLLDIYTMESTDGGNSWGKPSPVPRHEMSDNINRTRPNMLVLSSQRTFVFYQCGDNVCYIVRPPGSTLFQNEAVISKKTPESRIISTEVDTRPVTVVVSWLAEASDKKQEVNWTVAYSKNNGLSWDEDYMKRNSTQEKYYGADGIDGFGFVQSGDFALRTFPVCELASYPDLFSAETYFGKKWYRDVVRKRFIWSKEPAEYRVTQCKVGEEVRTYYYRASGSQTFYKVPTRFLEIDSKFKLKELPSPFGEIPQSVYSPNVGCLNGNKVFATSVVIGFAGYTDIPYTLQIAFLDSNELTKYQLLKMT